MIASVASGLIRSQGVDPLMDAVALGHMEGSLIWNPSPEADSIVELIRLVGDKTDSRYRDLCRLVVQVKTINGDQTDGIKTPLGLLDSLAVDARDREINGDATRKPSGSQTLAKALRPHLRTLADAKAVDREVAAAFREVVRVTAGVSRAALTSRALEHQLGRKRFTVLQDVIAEDRS